jgi:hypothetical protein
MKRMKKIMTSTLKERKKLLGNYFLGADTEAAAAKKKRKSFDTVSKHCFFSKLLCRSKPLLTRGLQTLA